MFVCLPSFQPSKLEREALKDSSLLSPLTFLLCTYWKRILYWENCATVELDMRVRKGERRFPAKRGKTFCERESSPLREERFTNRFHLNGFFCFFSTFFPFNVKVQRRRNLGEPSKCNFSSRYTLQVFLTWICLLSFCYGVVFDRYDRNFCFR